MTDMHLQAFLTFLHIFGSLTSALPDALNVRTSCSTPDGGGTCMSTSSCSGFSIPNYCPGGTDNQCCITKSCSNSQGKGTCKNTSKSCPGGYVSGLCPGDSSIKCCMASTSGGGSGNLPGLTAKQSGYARAIIARAKSDDVGHHGCEACVATALVESELTMYASNEVPKSLDYPHDKVHTDHKSIGLFQQQSTYYPNIACDMDAGCSAGQFIKEMKKVSGWKTMDVGDLCAKVQKPAKEYEYRYGERVAEAGKICSAGGL